MSARMRFVALATLALVSGLIWVSPASPAAPTSVRAAATITVPGDYATIQEAINAAAAGDTIDVSAGAYNGGLTINKALTLIAVDGPQQTTIGGPNTGVPIITATVPSGSVFTLQGFRLYGGSASIDNYGGGILLSGAGGATIKGNVFYANQADLIGGAIYTTAIGQVTIDGNEFISNTASLGGAIGVSQVELTTVVNNVFYRNGSGGTGSAVYWETPPGYVASIRSNTFAYNYTYGQGTGGTAIHLLGTYDGFSVVRNNIVYADTSQPAVVCEGSGGPAFAGNDFLNLSGAEVSGTCADPVGTNGNISVDPVFRNPDFDDYHIRPDSPLVDAGTADATVTTDIDGDARPFDGDGSGGAQIDIGADEATDSLLLSPDYIVFGSLGATEIGTHSDKTVTMENIGGSSVSVTSAVVGGQIADQVSTLADTCTGATLGAGQTCHVDLRYTPTSALTSDGILTITSPGVGGTRDYNLTGYATDPAQFWYDGWADVPVGTASPKFLHIDNISATQSLTVSSVAITGDAASDFKITSNACTAGAIAPQTTCDIGVTFTPSALGQRNATVTATGPSPVGTRSIDIYGNGVAPNTPVTLGTTYKAGPAYTWNSGNALGRTVKSGTQYLHQGYATDRISGSWAKDGGPYAGIYYTRSTSGSTWTTPKRVSPSTKHAIRFGLATSGSRVYVAYVTQTKIINYSPSAPRVLYVRVNTNHGAGSYWKSAVRLTSTTGRVDYPTVAASGYDVHIAWTNSNTGDVYVATSKDRGVTWVKRKVGTTSYSTSSGRIGYPSVAVSGSTVAVTWIADSSGALKSRVSTDRGTNWGATEQHISASTGEFQTAVRSGRVGVTWADSMGIHVRTWTSGSGWGNDYLAAVADLYAMYAPSIALQGTTRVAISYAEETATANYVRLRYAESTSNGATWYKPITLAGTTTSSRRANDWPSMVWPSTSTRYVSWNGWTNGTNNYRLYIRKGSGTPAGLASVATVVAPDGGLAPASASPLRSSIKTELLPGR